MVEVVVFEPTLKDLLKKLAIGLLTKSTQDRLVWFEMSISVKLKFQFYTDQELLKVATGTIDPTPTLLGLTLHPIRKKIPNLFAFLQALKMPSVISINSTSFKIPAL